MRIGSSMNTRISARLGIGFALVLVLTAVIGAFAIRSVTSVAQLTDNLYEHPFAVTKGLLEARVGILRSERAIRDTVLAHAASDIDRYAAETDAQYDAALQALTSARARFLGDPAGFDRAAQAFADYQKSTHEAVALARQDKDSEAIAYVQGRYAQAVQAVNEAMEPLIGFAGNKAAAFMQGAQSTRDHTVLLNLLLLGGAVLLGAVASVVATRSITRPLAALRACMAALADGRNDVAVAGLGRRDEVGEMAQAVEVFRRNAVEMDRMRNEQSAQEQRAAEERRAGMHQLADTFEAGIKVVVGSVAAQAAQMQCSAQALNLTAEHATQQATAVAASVEQASASVQTVASSAEELSASVLEIGRQVEQSSKIAGQAVTEADRTNATVEGLSRTAQRIGDVVQLIETIAGQTDLLALNATIEAARAGDALSCRSLGLSTARSVLARRASAGCSGPPRSPQAADDQPRSLQL